MNFLKNNKSKQQVDSDSAMMASDASTLTQSKAPSLMDNSGKDKQESTQSARQVSWSSHAPSEQGDAQNEKKDGEPQEATAEEQEEDDEDYPSGFKLAMITIALCLSVFCMALDNTIIGKHPACLTHSVQDS